MSTGTGRVYQRGGVWWIDYSFRGKRRRESSKSTLKKDAVALLRSRMAEMSKGRLISPDAEKITLGDLAEALRADYRANGRRTLERTEASLKALFTYFGEDARAVDITTDAANRYRAHRLEEGRAPATVQRELCALKRMFTLAYQAGRIAHPPHIPSIQLNNTRKGFFEPEDVERVLRQLPEHLRPVVRFAALTGWRKSEVVSLQWAQVDFNRGVVRLEPGTTKNGEGREFPFHVLPPLRELLEERRQYTRTFEKDNDRIVPHVFHVDGVPTQSFRRAWATATKKAGIPGALFHDLRRTAVRNLEAAGVPRSVAMKLTGHKTEAVYRRYAIADAARCRRGWRSWRDSSGLAHTDDRTAPVGTVAAQSPDFEGVGGARTGPAEGVKTLILPALPF